MANETLFRHGFSRDVLVQELNYELEKKRQTCRTIPGHPDRFIRFTEQRQYDAMRQIRDFLDDMSDETYNRLAAANAAKRAAIQQQLL